MLLRVVNRFSAATLIMLIRSGVCWWEQANELTETEAHVQQP
ncbi:hypothetical protein PMIT1320_00175 [Prochlorococcus marinus str. MIT 1320]|nr:hypothetical protein PMIT1320_00175 [Prochlorococcus marinus str. MIT 1320]